MFGQKDLIGENKKYIRHSKEYYEWLLKVCEKRNLDHIYVVFTKRKYRKYTKSIILQILKDMEEQK